MKATRQRSTVFPLAFSNQIAPMPKSTIDQEIRARIEAFTQELAELVKQAAVDSVQSALTDGSPTTRGRVSAARRTPRRAKKATRRTTSRSGRRSTAQVEAMGAEILSHIRSNPGHRLEEIGAALGVSTKDLKRPVANLLEERKVKTTGKARGTKYFVGGGRKKKAKRNTSNAKPKKVGRKKARKGGTSSGRRKTGTKRRTSGKRSKTKVASNSPALAGAA